MSSVHKLHNKNKYHMKKQYTKKQITEAIAYWKTILQSLNESTSILLNELCKEFSDKIVFSKNPFLLTSNNALLIANILNDILFNSQIKLPQIEILTYGQYCKQFRHYEIAYCDKMPYDVKVPKNTFFGTHYILVENDYRSLECGEPIQYSHEIIWMNSDKLKYRSFILNVASLCHELIHCYDVHFGDSNELARYCILSNQDINKYSHNTYTFKNKQQLAIDNNLKVIAKMDKKDKILDKEAIKLMIQALTKDELKFIQEKQQDINHLKSKQKFSVINID